MTVEFRRIVFLAPFGIRPKGTLIARMLPLAAKLVELGCHITIVAPPYTNPEDSGLTEIIDGVHVVNIRLSSLGKTLGAPLLAWRMYKIMRKEQPDLVHLFKPKGYGGLTAMLMCLLSSFGAKMPPLFVDTDDWEGKGGMNKLHAYSLPAKWFYSLQEKWLPLRAVGVTVASRALEERIFSFGVPKERISYIPNGTNERPAGSGSCVREKFGLDGDAPVVLLYTRFFEFPQSQLYEVFAGIAENIPEVRFLVVGQGRFGEDEKLRVSATERGFAENLIQTGWLEPEEIVNYVSAADLAIYPFADTLLNRCKCPAKLVEIMRSGVPVVADAVGQIAEYIVNGESGILCSPGNVDQMVNESIKLIHDKSARVKIGSMAQKRILNNFSWYCQAERLMNFYRTSLK